ncbi:MAG: capsule assembly Wzi family protein [Chitinophagaceae bacterium]|nr:capsule assembly Wzi family protein [Chitinophagaceae bacterium]
MQIKQNHVSPLKVRFWFLGVSLFFLTKGKSQSTFLAPGEKSFYVFERLEILARTDSLFNYSKVRPFDRKALMDAVNRYASRSGLSLSKTDMHNLRSLNLNHTEWLNETERNRYLSRKPVARRFYRTPAHLYEVHVKDFNLIVDPVFQYTISAEQNSSEHLFQNTRGVFIRGKIADKIGFYSYITDNQERDPTYVRRWVSERKAVPNQGFYKDFKGTGYDYFEARGYITFPLIRKYSQMAFGYDRQFIGTGYRSLFLSDFGANRLFLSLNTRIWKINYRNLFLELQSSASPAPTQLIPKKYAAIHHLDIGLNRWLNVGLFEGVVFGRKDRFDFSYLNPIIFYRSIEQQNGSFDNAVVGMDAKANLLGRVQAYGQLLLDEFSLSEIKAGRNWWANKWGYQLGVKCMNVFGVPNLDVQAEYNRVRPFTYSHYDSVANYTHYNQPLAHPLGAGFGEVLGIIRYQPAPKWLLQGKLIAWKQGKDSSQRSFGSNILLPNTPPFRQGDYGYKVGTGWTTQTLYASLLLSYEIRENLFLESHAVFRKEKTTVAPLQNRNVSVLTIGLRWNIQRREFEF